MRTVGIHSRLNGYESVLIHHSRLWRGLRQLVERAESAYAIRERLADDTWTAVAGSSGAVWLQDRVALHLPVLPGERAPFFAIPLAFYISGQIDLGIEILPMKQMQAQMSSRPGYYEGALYDLARQGRGVPAVPLILIGVVADKARGNSIRVDAPIRKRP